MTRHSRISHFRQPDDRLAPPPGDAARLEESGPAVLPTRLRLAWREFIGLGPAKIGTLALESHAVKLAGGRRVVVLTMSRLHEDVILAV